jgi:hypothetical protein
MAGTPIVQCVGPSYHLTDIKVAIVDAVLTAQAGT